MTNEELLQLLNKYPFLIIKDYNGKSYYSSEDLPKHNYYTYWDNTGWGDIWKKFLYKIFNLYDTLSEQEKQVVEFYDIKEKYGGLRVDLSYPISYNNDFRELISQVEILSEVTCIRCGKISKDSKGNPIIWVTRGYISPLCKKCAKDMLRCKKCYDKKQIAQKLVEMRCVNTEFVNTSESTKSYREVHYKLLDGWIKPVKIIEMQKNQLNDL